MALLPGSSRGQSNERSIAEIMKGREELSEVIKERETRKDFASTYYPLAIAWFFFTPSYFFW